MRVADMRPHGLAPGRTERRAPRREAHVGRDCIEGTGSPLSSSDFLGPGGPRPALQDMPYPCPRPSEGDRKV